MPNIVKLVLSSLLQGSSLVAAMDFFSKLVILQVMEYSQVVKLLTSAVYNPSGPQPSPSSSNFVVHRQV